MQPHQQRVVDEKAELDEKLTKLDAFGRTPLFASLPPDEQGRLNRQQSLMEQALKAQTNRIKTLETECEVERLRLAACGVAALGYFDGCKDEYKSASLDDVLRLNKRCTDLRAELDSLAANAIVAAADSQKACMKLLDEDLALRAELADMAVNIATYRYFVDLANDTATRLLKERDTLRAELAEIAAAEPVAYRWVWKSKPWDIEGWCYTNTPPTVPELQEIEQLFTRPMPAQDVTELVEALEKLARLGNGDQYGNSDGNMIARDALSKYKGAK